MIDINIKEVNATEVRELQNVSRKTFSETFSSRNTKENMDKYLEEGLSLTKLSEELEDPNAEFYFAFDQHKIIGYLKLNFGNAQTELKDGKAMEIERIYVLKEYHGKNVGQVLFEKAIEIASLQRCEYVWLGVWEENPRAINFYQKNGFVKFDKHIFKLGNDDQTDIMMKLQLKK